MFCLIFIVLVLLGCSDENGIIKADDLSNVSSYFSATAVVNVDSVSIERFSQDRFRKLKNLRAVFVWDKVGRWYRDFEWSEIGEVNPESPFMVDFDLKKLPERHLLNQFFIPFGKVWYYVDGNENGQLDTEIFPDVIVKYRKERNEALVDLEKAQKRLLTFSIVTEGREDTLFLDYKDLSIQEKKTGFIWKASISPKDFGADESFTMSNSIGRILVFFDRWEWFFDARGGLPKIEKLCSPTSCILKIKRRLWPIKGKESEFYESLAAFADKLLVFRKTLGIKNDDEGLSAAFEIKPNRDWIVGIQQDFHVLYLHNDSLVNELLAANKNTSVQLQDSENFRPGYNVVECRIDGKTPYICKINEKKKLKDTLKIEMFSKWEQFEDPSDVPDILKDSDSSLVLNNEYFDVLSGEYTISETESFSLHVLDSSLWIRLPNFNNRKYPFDQELDVRLSVTVRANDTIFSSPYFQGRQFLELQLYAPGVVLFSLQKGNPKIAKRNGDASGDLTSIQNHIADLKNAKESVFLVDEIWSRGDKNISFLGEEDVVIYRDYDLQIVDWPFFNTNKNGVWNSKDIDMELIEVRNEEGDVFATEIRWGIHNWRVSLSSWVEKKTEDNALLLKGLE